MNEPTNQMASYQSIKKVLAGKIIEIVPAGCYVENDGGDAILRLFEPKMTERYQPVVGDYWVVYEDGYQSISPKHAFDTGYTKL